MSTFLSRTLAEWAAGVTWDDLSPDAVVAAKRFLYDSLGCAFGGALTEDCSIAAGHAEEKGAKGNCTVLVRGTKTHAEEASFLNALMIRAMDYNDIYWKQDPSHPSDLIPAALAISEREDLSGRDLLIGIVLAYEVEMRLCEFALPGIRERGWHHATLTAFASPLVAGRLLGLDAGKMQNALGISACRHLTLGAAVAGRLTMMKNTVDPMATRAGVESALLAARGYTGPENVLDGKEGMFHCLGPDWDEAALTGGLGEHWKIGDCGMKAFPTEALTHTPITATLDLVRKHDIAADDIREIRIETIARAADILSDPSKYDPRSKETADHSLPYCIAAAVTDRMVTPAQFREEKIFDPKLREQLLKIKVSANKEFEKLFPKIQPVRVEIETTGGAVHERRIDVPRGNPDDPMSDEDLDGKFNALASPSFSEERRAKIREAVFSIDTAQKISDFTDLCVADLT